jgi:hypothetical protein
LQNKEAYLLVQVVDLINDLILIEKSVGGARKLARPDRPATAAGRGRDECARKKSLPAGSRPKGIPDWKRQGRIVPAGHRGY